MAAEDVLIIEDGTGVPNANTYATLAEYKDYLTMYNNTAALAKTDEALVASLLSGADYLNTYKFKGVQSTQMQGLVWPRGEVFLRDDPLPLPDNVIPSVIKKAQMAASEINVGGQNLQPNILPGTFLKRNKVGPLEKEYFNGMDSGIYSPTFSFVDGILADYLTGGTGMYSLRTKRI